MFAYTMWVFGQDYPTIMYEKEADMAVIKLGENYLKGGLEYYNKIIQRNIALHTLMGEEGKKLFTAGGNEQVFIRTKHLPLAMRRDYFKMKVDELNKTKEISNDSKELCELKVDELSKTKEISNDSKELCELKVDEISKTKEVNNDNKEL